MLRLACLAVSITLAGCTLDWWGGGDDDCLALDGPALAGTEADRAGLAAALELVNPETLTCEIFGWNECGACGCLPGDAVPIPTWGYCDSACTGLTEGLCLQATGCRAAYDWACYTGDAPCSALQPFLGCYATDMTGPIQGACTGLSAYECSQHDDCIALHSEVCTSNGVCIQSFVECGFEPAPCDAGPGGCG